MMPPPAGREAASDRSKEDADGEEDHLPDHPRRVPQQGQAGHRHRSATCRCTAEVKEFSTGSLGWYLNGKTTIDVDGTPVSVQIGMNLTIVGRLLLGILGGAAPDERGRRFTGPLRSPWAFPRTRPATTRTTSSPAASVLAVHPGDRQRGARVFPRATPQDARPPELPTARWVRRTPHRRRATAFSTGTTRPMAGTQTQRTSLRPADRPGAGLRFQWRP